jgi:hypothetical protein
VAFGEHRCFAIRGDTLEEVDGGIAEVSAALADLGMSRCAEIALERPSGRSSWQLPYIARRGLVSTSNPTSLASLHFASAAQRATTGARL